jgi:flagellin
MASEIQQNTNQINSYWQKNVNESDVAQALEKLSSGYGVDYSPDKTGGLSTSRDIDRELMRIELQRLEKAQHDIDQTSSMLQLAEGGLDNILEKLFQMKDLATQATEQGRSDRGVLAAEANSLVNDIDEIARDTEYNDQNLLNGDLEEGIKTGVLDQNGNELEMGIDSVRANRLGLTSGQTALKEIASGGAADLSTIEGANRALNILDNAIQDIKAVKGNIDAFQTMLGDEAAKIQNSIDNTTAAHSTIQDIGSANQTTAFIKNQILMDSGKALMAQANMSPQSVLSFLELG